MDTITIIGAEIEEKILTIDQKLEADISQVLEELRGGDPEKRSEAERKVEELKSAAQLEKENEIQQMTSAIRDQAQMRVQEIENLA